MLTIRLIAVSAAVLLFSSFSTSQQERLARTHTATQIQAMLDSVSADTMRSYLNTLVGFGT